MRWQIDPIHSSVTVAVRYMMVSTVRGRFSSVRGTLNFDPEKPERASAEIVIDAASIDTNDANRDGHLRSPDFFDAATYPEITFRSTNVERRPDGAFALTGDLTIRGTTKPATLDVEVEGVTDDPRAGKRAGFSATAVIDRRDWGLVWNMPVPSGVLVGEKVKIEFDISAVPAAEAKAT